MASPCATSELLRSLNDAAADEAQRSLSERYNLGKEIGTGRFACVFEATDAETGIGYAVKIVKPKRPASLLSRSSKSSHTSVKRQADSFLSLVGALACSFCDGMYRHESPRETEQDIWRSIGRHDHCVALLNSFQIQGSGLSFMVMDSCHSDLLRVSKEIADFSETHLSQLAHQMLLGIGHLHGLGIVHRDLKPEHFLVDSDNKIKICDFGLAARVPQRGLLRGTVGTPPFMSPEMVCCDGHDQSTDIWSFGVTLFNILYGKYPYPYRSCGGQPDAKSMMFAIKVDMPRPTFEHIDSTKKRPSLAAQQYVQALMVRCPQQRPSAHEAIEHSFIVSAIRGHSESVKNLVKNTAVAATVDEDVCKSVGDAALGLSFSTSASTATLPPSDSGY